MESEVYRMWELDKNLVIIRTNTFIFHWSLDQISSCYLIMQETSLPTEITQKSLCIQRFKPQT